MSAASNALHLLVDAAIDADEALDEGGDRLRDATAVLERMGRRLPDQDKLSIYRRVARDLGFAEPVAEGTPTPAFNPDTARIAA